MKKGMMAVLEKHFPEKATPGEMLKAMRKREGYTLEIMERITKIKVSNLSALENDKLDMTKHYAEIFAAALRVHPTLFLYPDGKFAPDGELLQIAKRAAEFRKRA